MVASASGNAASPEVVGNATGASDNDGRQAMLPPTDDARKKSRLDTVAVVSDLRFSVS